MWVIAQESMLIPQVLPKLHFYRHTLEIVTGIPMLGTQLLITIHILSALSLLLLHQHLRSFADK